MRRPARQPTRTAKHPARRPERAARGTARATTRPARRARIAAKPAPQISALDPRQIALMADQAIAGGVVQPASIPELCGLLDVLRERGYELKRRTEWEQHAAPWLLIVVPLPGTTLARTTGVSAK